MLDALRKRAWYAYSRRRVRAQRFGRLGEGSTFQPPAVVTLPERVFIGDGTFFHTGAWLSLYDEHHGQRFDPRLTIGDRCVFGRDIWISCVGEITIGDEVYFGDRLVISDSHHGYDDPDVNIIRQPMAEPKPVRIGEGAFINMNVVILSGVTVGARAYIAANSVVTKDVEANTVVAGVPAKVIRRYDRAAGAWVDL